MERNLETKGTFTGRLRRSGTDCPTVPQQPTAPSVREEPKAYNSLNLQPATRNLPVITVKNVEKCYKLKGGFYYVLQQINFTIEQGDFVSIMGPSGAGKSTLLHILGLHDGWSLISRQRLE